MKVLKNRKRYFAPALVMCSAFFAIFFAACTTSQQADYNAGSGANTLQIGAELKHSPVGMVDLTWNPDNQNLEVKVSATGLAPNSTHPEHIHAGTCASNPMGAIIYTLNPLVADAHGVGSAETTIENVKNGIPVSGWYVNVHNGPTLNSDLQAQPIACGTVSNEQTSKNDKQTVHLTLQGTMAPNEDAHGSAQVRVEDNKIVVTLTVYGLAPNTTHMAHIHAGSCENQGAVVYPLQPAVADAHGDSTTTTTINNVKHFSPSRLYINVHEAGTMAGMATQQGFDPMACGNLTLH